MAKQQCQFLTSLNATFASEFPSKTQLKNYNHAYAACQHVPQARGYIDLYSMSLLLKIALLNESKGHGVYFDKRVPVIPISIARFDEIKKKNVSCFVSFIQLPKLSPLPAVCLEIYEFKQ